MKLTLVYADVEGAYEIFASTGQTAWAAQRLVEIDLTPEQVAILSPNKGEELQSVIFEAEAEKSPEQGEVCKECGKPIYPEGGFLLDEGWKCKLCYWRGG